MATIASLLDALLSPKPVSGAPAGGDIQQEKVHLSERMAELET